MAFTIEPYPQFSWSMTRQRLLDTCPRAYYIRYYVGHNGWLDGADERTRLAYRLSKLTGLDAILGSEMDERAREIETAVRAGSLPPSADELEERTRRTLRDAWKSSRDQRAAFERSPNRVTMLQSFYLDNEPPDERTVDRINEKLPACIANLLAVADWERLAACGGDGCVLIPDFAHFMLGGVKVFAASDLAYIADGVLHVIDWKSGRPGDDDTTQVLLAAYAAALDAGVATTAPAADADDPFADWAPPPASGGGRTAGGAGTSGSKGAAGGASGASRATDTSGRASASGASGAGSATTLRPELHYLLTGDSHVPNVPSDLESFVAEVVAAGIKTMRNLLLDPYENAPLPEDEFERRESGLCNGHCAYAQLCVGG